MTMRTYSRQKFVPHIDDPIAVAEILPPIIADRVRMMLTPQIPFNQRENARNTLILIRDELDKVLGKAAKDFVRRM